MIALIVIANIPWCSCRKMPENSATKRKVVEDDSDDEVAQKRVVNKKLCTKAPEGSDDDNVPLKRSGCTKLQAKEPAGL